MSDDYRDPINNALFQTIQKREQTLGFAWQRSRPERLISRGFSVTHPVASGRGSIESHEYFQ
jgi:hypothetical protein